ncbi:MAG: acyl-CoA dehydrogenase family protein [Adlercreutzia equolifaciens]
MDDHHRHQDADGKIHINGTKTWVTSGENSDGFIVVCKDEDPSAENKEMSMYLVPANSKGVTIEPLNKIGMQIMRLLQDHLRRRRG